MSGALQVGDRMRFSTELLKQIDEMPDRHSELVEVVEIRVFDDGTKLVALKRVEE